MQLNHAPAVSATIVNVISDTSDIERSFHNKTNAMENTRAKIRSHSAIRAQRCPLSRNPCVAADARIAAANQADSAGDMNRNFDRK
jgi:hypothetical protein